MRRILALSILCVAVLLGGCQFEPTPPRTDWTGLVATELMIESLQVDAQPPRPLPDGVCKNCSGRGQVGDGVVTIRCPVCDGTGRADQPDARRARPIAHVRPTPASGCPGGVCPLPRSGVSTRTTVRVARPACSSSQSSPRRRWFPRLRSGWRRLRWR